MKHEIIHTIFDRGGENTAFAQYFVGQSYLNMLSTQAVSHRQRNLCARLP